MAHIIPLGRQEGRARFSVRQGTALGAARLTIEQERVRRPTYRVVQAKQQRGQKVTMLDYRRKQQEAMMHKLVNHVIEVAIEHRSGIVTEDLSIHVRGKFVRSAWAKLEFILEYKCRLAGVPYLGKVFAAKTSQICIWCGEIVERNDRVVTCHACGAVEHSDDAAGVNIARRVMYRKKDWEKKGGYLAFHRSFSNLGSK
jgi:IS605 OrfB family transposase